MKESTAWACFLFLCMTELSLAAPPFLVGDAGRLDKIQLQGIVSFPVEEVVFELKLDPYLFPVRRPDALLTNLLQRLDKRLTACFGELGFAEAQVTSQWNEEQQGVEINVVEGPRFRWRNIVLQGVPEDCRNLILTGLQQGLQPETEGMPGTSDEEIDAVFSAGKFISNTPGMLRNAQKLVEMQLARHALMNAQFDMRIDLDSPAAQADLVVNMSRPGPRATFSEIAVQGCQRQSVAEVLKLIPLKPGDPCPRQALEQIQQRLWETGRFRTSRVTLGSALFPDDPRTLNVEVEEWTQAPLLQDSLDEMQQVAIRAAHWFSTSYAKGLDLRVQIESIAEPENDSKSDLLRLLPATFILSTEKGILLDLNGTSLENAFGERLAFTFSRRSMSVADPQQGQGTMIPYSSQTQLMVKLIADGMPEPVKEGRESRLTFGFGFTTAEHPSDIAAMQLSVSPMWMLRHLEQNRDHFTLNSEELIFQDEGSRIVYEAATGRLKEFKLLIDPFVMTVTLQQDLFTQYQQNTLAAVEYRDHEPAIRLSEAVFFAEKILARFTAEEDHSRLKRWQMILQLANRYCREVDDFTLQLPDFSSKTAFQMPSDNQIYGLEWLRLISRILYEPSTPPLLNAQIQKLATAVIVKDATQFDHALSELKQSGLGGLTHLLIAGLFRFSHAKISDKIASQGLTCLDEERFRHDLQLLMLAWPTGKKQLQQLGQFLRAEQSGELRAILEDIVSKEELELLQHQAEDPDIDHYQFAESVLGLSWQHGGRDLVQGLLIRLCLKQPDQIVHSP